MADVGRPKEDITSLPEAWASDVLSIYRDGGSDVEVKALIHEWRGSFSNDLWDRWLLEEPQFSETIKVGKMLAEAWWSKQGRTNLTAKDFNYTGWYMNMKNRYGWRDRTDLTSDDKALTTALVEFIGEDTNADNENQSPDS